MKHISYEDLRESILQCKKEVLTQNILESLIKYIPAPAELEKLKGFLLNYHKLVEAEQFAISISGIVMLESRLKSMMFEYEFADMVQLCKPNIVSATVACKEVKESQKFSKILELVLCIGKFPENID